MTLPCDCAGPLPRTHVRLGHVNVGRCASVLRSSESWVSLLSCTSDITKATPLVQGVWDADPSPLGPATPSQPLDV